VTRPTFRPWPSANDTHRSSSEWAALLNGFVPALEDGNMVGLVAGKGVVLTSPDGLTVKVLRIDDTGTLELIDP
jgi:hypothetical protein